MQSFALNGYKAVLDGQWQGIRYASDGNVYFGSSTHSAHHGAAFFKYDPRTGQVTMLAEDLSVICGEDPYTNPQGKLHSDIVEANGWLFMSIHFSSEKPGAYDVWSGAHVIGYHLETGVFRDYGVVHPKYTSYSAIGVDPLRNYLYVFVTGQYPTDVSYLYRIDTVSGAKTNLGQVGGSFHSSFWMFVDQRGDAWFSVAGQNGTLQRVRGATGVIDVYPNALPPMYRWDTEQVASGSDQAQRWIMWMQPLDGDRAVFTLGWFGGMMYLFDSSKPIGSGQEFKNLRHIGYSDLGLAVDGTRVFYYQRANRGFGHQEADDFHLLSVSLEPEAGYPITDYGLLKDQDGRTVWRVPGMAADGHGKVFMVGDWWTVAGDIGTSRYRWNGGAEYYEPLPRGEFFAVADIGDGADLSTVVLAPTVVRGGSATTGNYVRLNAPAPAGGALVELASSHAAAQPPLTVLVPEGTMRSADFTITTNAVAVDEFVTITASYGRFTRAATLTVAAGAAASFLGVDSTTRGNWKGVYGASGHMLVNHSTSLPSFAEVIVPTAGAWTWSASTTDPRALQKVGASDRVAATWYTTSGGDFSVDVSFSDELPHRVALFAVDWDTPTRRQRVEVLEAATGAVLDTRDMTTFAGGQYLVWQVMGRVRFRVTHLGGINGVLSALFIDPDVSAPANAPPTVTLSAPDGGPTFTAPAAIRLKATAGDTDGTVTKVEFFAGSTLVGTATTAPFEIDWLTPPVGSHTLQARATDDDQAVTLSATVGITVHAAPAGGGTAATFLSADTTTRGSWRGVYGAAGYLLVNHQTSLPGFAQVTPNGPPAAWTWMPTTTDTRALQKVGASDRIAATWYTTGPSGFTIDVNFTDGQPHQLALYAVDWDNVARRQRVELLDAVTQAVLDTREMNAFSGGQYLVWRISGRVRLRVTVLSGVNAVVSALFFDGDGGGSANAPPTVALASPDGGPTFTAPASIRLKATAGDSDGTVSKVEFFNGSTLVGTATSAPFEIDWNNPPVGSHTLQARATDDDQATALSNTVAITVNAATPPGAPTASFLAADATTRGAWRGTYGTAGHMLVNHATSLPSYAQVTTSSPPVWTWSASTGDSRALQKVAAADRIAATWYTASSGASFTIDVNVTDGQPHQVALYALDWDSSTRRQRVEVLDAATNGVLDTREMASFNGGHYLVWRVTGRVRIRVTHTGGVNAVVSAIFID